VLERRSFEQLMCLRDKILAWSLIRLLSVT
jgi:hypothetical protein